MLTQTYSSPQPSRDLSNISHQEGQSDAWLLQYALGAYVALPIKACQEIVESPAVLAVPSMRSYALGMLRWREQWLSLIDLNSLLSGEAAKPISDESHCLIVAYYTADNQVGYVALSLPYFPYLLQVNDNAICALPSDNSIWQTVADSCFRFQNHRVPIVNGSKLFSRAI